MEVLYIYGPSGTGKTTLAKLLAKNRGFDVFVSGSSNDPLEGYLGQECVILDDIRGSDWKMNDLLKLLDNNTNSLAKSRYSNKLLNDCKLMVLTSVQSVDDLYRGIKQSGDIEPITQLKRRCGALVWLEKSTMHCYGYNEQIGDYEWSSDAPNPVQFVQFVADNRSVISDLLSVAAEMCPTEQDAAR